MKLCQQIVGYRSYYMYRVSCFVIGFKFEVMKVKFSC
jgi:hypothetical protein